MPNSKALPLWTYPPYTAMNVIFTKTRERAYRVSIQRPGAPELIMDPAPGYHDLLPHDLVHLIVEVELGLRGGVYGQLAAGGDAGTFRPVDSNAKRKLAKRGDALMRTNREDVERSERLAHLCWLTW